jgi:ring-1,2-phenylacetyl-CoA epoxidase subunit PaaD
MLENEIFQLLEVVHDPEIPSLSIKDLGVLRTARVSEGVVEVVITPTYSGCPAMDVIEADIIKCLTSNGFRNVLVTTRLAPAWTTEWLSDRGRETLKKAGIAPPSRCGTLDFSANKVVQCPMCNSKSVELLSQFGTTACKALYRCHSCLEPFDYFKCH